MIFFLYLGFAVAVVFLYLKTQKKAGVLEIKADDIREKINLIKESIYKEELHIIALDRKIVRYKSLRESLDKFNHSLVLEEVGNIITEEVFRLFGSVGTVLLYLIDPEENNLEVVFTHKIFSVNIIKEKRGDLFDEWALRHNQALLVEDTRKDFRFDYGRIKEGISREIGSVISAPLITTHKFLGILRVESLCYGQFSSDDLRFLSIIAGLATVALENSILFQHTEELAIRDGLTGLHLRRFLDERGKEEIHYCSQEKKYAAFLMLDVDYFKRYNDQFGHRSGDIVLQHIAEFLKGIVHDRHEVVSRFGGEEFAILLPAVKKDEALRIAESIRRGIEEGIIFLRRSPRKVTVSIGVAVYPEDAPTWQGLIKQADIALYKAKQEGRNRVCFL